MSFLADFRDSAVLPPLSIVVLVYGGIAAIVTVASSTAPG
jgi:hypothetical protein